MAVYLEKRVVLGLITALVVLAGLGVMSFLNNQKFAFASGRIAHTNEVLYHGEQLLAVIVDAETGQRGFSITGNAAFLDPYNKSLPLVNGHFERLMRLTIDNNSQQLRLVNLRLLIDQKMAITTENVRLSKLGLSKVQEQMETMQGKKVMDNIRSVIADFQNEEKTLLEQRAAQGKRDIENFNIAYGALIAMTLLVLFFVFAFINRQLKARVQAELSLKKAANEVQDLYDNAPCGYQSVDANGIVLSMNNTLRTWLQYTRAEIEKSSVRIFLNAQGIAVFNEVFPKFKAEGKITNLEMELVRKDGSTLPVVVNSLAVFDRQGNYQHSRTTIFDNTERRAADEKLRRANRELEGFTYTISHDLRAPLRSINGYASILNQDHGSSLDLEGKRLLNVIAKNARQMGQLIDDLLEFSRIGKKDLLLTKISMDDIIRPIVDELVEQEKSSGRNPVIILYLMEPALVDVAMMRQVWVNLISNALKYSSRMEVPRLEIGSYPVDQETVYFVKDNGVGFDMQYVNKLFGVFQRLHKSQDFEGTGVGLAIVKRIVERHGGKVWAESTQGVGASFYFSIPNV